jgi:surface antigen
MLFDLVDVLQKKRRLFGVAIFIAVDFWLLTFCSQTLQAHRTNITAHIHNAEIASAQPQYQGELFTDDILASIEHAASTTEIGTLRMVVAATDGFTRAQHSTQAGALIALHDISAATVIGLRATNQAIAFVVHINVLPYVFIGRGVGHTFGTVFGLAHSGLASVTQTQQDANVPVITPEQAAQAFSIQENTVAFTPTKPTGAGGACDSGSGNGGYPMEWCNARMDSIQTASSSGRINRECTSYAFWYFTTIEGHPDFAATGNANRWASTSNYPTHAAPAVGAIAVETTGAYGHVAIVQALPGQAYDGEVVPTGNVLVSEMNYDWQGHFRYSYSPLSKFSAYIYR